MEKLEKWMVAMPVHLNLMQLQNKGIAQVFG